MQEGNNGSVPSGAITYKVVATFANLRGLQINTTIPGVIARGIGKAIIGGTVKHLILNNSISGVECVPLIFAGEPGLDQDDMEEWTIYVDIQGNKYLIQMSHYFANVNIEDLTSTWFQLTSLTS